MPYLQDLVATVDATFAKFDCSGLINAEYKRRVISQCNNVDNRRVRSFYCSWTQQNAEDSEIKIQKYFISLKKLEEKAVIIFKDRLHFGVVAHGNKIFVMGGKANGIILKSVSKPIRGFIFNRSVRISV